MELLKYLFDYFKLPASNASFERLMAGVILEKVVWMELVSNLSQGNGFATEIEGLIS